MPKKFIALVGFVVLVIAVVIVVLLTRPKTWDLPILTEGTYDDKPGWLLDTRDYYLVAYRQEGTAARVAILAPKTLVVFEVLPEVSNGDTSKPSIMPFKKKSEAFGFANEQKVKYETEGLVVSFEDATAGPPTITPAP